MIRLPVSVTLITKNEEADLPRAIQSVKWADDILVVDSGSTDSTVQKAQELGARVLINPWQGYGQQKNFAQSNARYEWVLNIDADEEVPPELAHEIQEMLAKAANFSIDARGFSFPRKTFYMGRWIRHGGWYPNTLVRLTDRRFSRWTEPEVHETLIVDGPVIQLKHPLHHFTFNGIEDQVITNLGYAKKGALQLTQKGQSPSLIKLLIKPLWKFLDSYLLKRGFLDGIAGFIIAINAAHSMFLKYATLFESRITDASSRNRQQHRQKELGSL